MLASSTWLVVAGFLCAACDGESNKHDRRAHRDDDERAASSPRSRRATAVPAPPSETSSAGRPLGPSCAMYFEALECMASNVDEGLAADIRKSARETRATIDRMHPALPEEGCRAATLEMKDQLETMGCGAFVPPPSPSPRESSRPTVP